MVWIYQDKPFKPEQIDNNVGFVYQIDNVLNGKKYIGKKLFSFAKTKGPLKGRVNRRRSRVASDWEDYFGSNKELLEDVVKHGKEHFTRTILRLCSTKGTCSYYETKLIMESDALLKDEYYNTWAICKINKSQIK